MGQPRQLLAHQDPVAHVAIEDPAHGEHGPVERAEVIAGLEAIALADQGEKQDPGRVGSGRSPIARGIVGDQPRYREGAAGAGGLVGRASTGVRWRNKKRFTST